MPNEVARKYSVVWHRRGVLSDLGEIQTQAPREVHVWFLDEIDQRLRPQLHSEFAGRRHEVVEPLPRGVTVVLAGHRAAGKSRLLEGVAVRLGREAIDLDAELERKHGRALRHWVEEDESSFRAAEKQAFLELPPGSVVAVGGGFLSHHAQVLRNCVVALVPISFETYRERLLGDVTRPRLLPQLDLESEIRQVFFEREEKHAAARPLPWVDFLLRLERGSRPRRVVTLAPGAAIDAFALRAAKAGADLLEVRSDLVPASADLAGAAGILGLLVSQRTPDLPERWLEHATLVDRPLGDAYGNSLVSFHSEEPLTPQAARALWASVPCGLHVKHVEPLGRLSDAERLFETHARLVDRFGPQRVTVLATGPLALPFRALLARDNALDYLALDASWSAAAGQRLLADAKREWRRPSRDGKRDRLAILGSGIAHSKSPSIHPAPFDRIDVPPETDMGALLEALAPHYRGFAVTSPFKQAVAKAIGSSCEAVNTLVRTQASSSPRPGSHSVQPDRSRGLVEGLSTLLEVSGVGQHLLRTRTEGWEGSSTDESGAQAVIAALGAREVTVLGEGGVASALTRAAENLGVTLSFLKRGQAVKVILRQAAIWTWPVDFEPPEGLRFEGAKVALIAYGAPARRLAQRIAALGGVPLRLGPKWFIAQARSQRRLWEEAS